MGKIRTENKRHKRHAIAVSQHQPKAVAVLNIAAKPAKSSPQAEAS